MIGVLHDFRNCPLMVVIPAKCHIVDTFKLSPPPREFGKPAPVAR